MLKKIEKYIPEILIFLFALLTRFWRLDFPPSYYFDEVYHVFTAEQMLKGNPAAWEWWNPNPTGFAYEWTHPPLAKEFMWFAMGIFGDNPFAWRFFSALFGTGSIILIYFISLSLFKSRKIALLSSIAASLSGLLLVMSRIGMNDSYFLFFSLLAILFFLNKKNLLMGIALGLALASKWTTFFLIFFIIPALFLFKIRKDLNLLKIFVFGLLFLIIVPAVVYLSSYTPFFLGNHMAPGKTSVTDTFIELQKQMWWYHTSLKATHPYQSRPYQWVLNLRPVWLYVDNIGNNVANIYTLENPLLAWFGILSILFLIYSLSSKFSFPEFFIVFSYFLFFVPWQFSPRIMFNYHYLPSTAFLTIAIGFVLNELAKGKNGKIFAGVFFLALIVSFIYFYPLFTGLHLSRPFYDSHFWLTSWK